MNERDDQQLRELLRKTIAPVAEANLKRDLWPQMRRKLDEPGMRMPWFDWVLVALVVILCILFPEAVPGLLYHL